MADALKLNDKQAMFSSASSSSIGIDSKLVPSVNKAGQGPLLNSKETKAHKQTVSTTSCKGKKCPAPAQGRAKLVKQKREEESKRIQLANQKRITDWVGKAEKRREDKEEERRQLEAMRKKKEESARKEPAFLHKISLSPSPTARRILNLPSPTHSEPTAPLPSYQESPEEPLLPFPTLSSALKSSVLKGVAKKIDFQPKICPRSVPAAPKPCKSEEKEGCPSKELQHGEREPSSVLSSQEQGDQPTGNGFQGKGRPTDEI